MSDILTETEKLDPDTGEPLIAHIVRKGDQMRGYLGEEIEALCGKRFIPHRDYEGLPICEACKAKLHLVGAAGSN